MSEEKLPESEQDRPLIDLILPFPPSVNHYWKHSVRKNHKTGKHYVHVELSTRAQEYRVRVHNIILRSGNRNRFINGERIRLEIVLFPKTLGKFDIDNNVKALQDACTHAKFWGDDWQIDQLVVERGHKKAPHGEAHIYVREITSPCVPV